MAPPIENSGSARLCIEAITGEADYCIPTFQNPCSTYHYITGFQTFGAVSNIENINSTCSAYSLFEEQTLEVEAGTFFDFEVDGSFYHSQVESYADWNCDGDFDDGPDMAYISGRINEEDFEDRIFIPADAVNGTSRLRIIAHWEDDEAGGYPCGNYQTGECEDYLLTIHPASPMVFQAGTTLQCDTLRPAGRVETNREIIKILLNVTGSLNPLAVTAINLSPEGCTDFDNDVDHVNIYYTGNYDIFSTDLLFGTTDDLTNPVTGNLPLIYGPNYFWVTFTTSSAAALGNYLDASCESVIFNGTEIIIPEITSPEGTIKIDYCLPLFSSPGGCEAGIGCQSFSTEGGIENISNLNNGCPGNELSYSDFTDQKVISTQGNSISFYYSTDAWWLDVELTVLIDWNQDIDFDDPGESYGFTVTEFITGQFVVPGNALPGETRLRLLSWQYWQPKTGDPANNKSGYCGWWSDQGEIEDYTIEIMEAPLMTQTIEIPGGWSGFSTYLQPENNEMDGMFAPIENELVILSDFNQVYWPGQNTNTYLTGWHSWFGAQIKMSGSSTLNVSGYQTNRQFSLKPGWNYLPVLSECPVDVSGWFSPLQTIVKVVKDIAGTGVYWPEYNINTLQELNPGKAYFIYWDIGLTLPVVYPECEKGLEISSFSNLQNPVTPWNEPAMNPASHLVAFPEDVTRNLLETGDIIGSFTAGDFCSGLSLFEGYDFAQVIFGDDPVTPEKDGFTGGENIAFRIYRPSAGEMFDMIVEYDATGSPGSWTENGLSVVKSVKIYSSHMGNGSEIIIFPNPGDGKFEVRGLTSPAKISVRNIGGEGVFTAQNFTGGQIDLSACTPGLYLVNILSMTQSLNYKLIIE